MERIDQIRRRLAVITPGPWKADRNWHITGPRHDWDKQWVDGCQSDKDRQIICHVHGPRGSAHNNPSGDYTFIVNAPDDMSILLAEIDILSKRVEQLTTMYNAEVSKPCRQCGLTMTCACDY